nr:tetrahydromethanopterin S-methyltransferase subunit H [Candidatus Njordarchaeota archaeon]
MRFNRPQAIFDIGGIKFGGQVGQNPTVLIGTIFYDKHKIVSDPVKGEFDRAKAEELINRQQEMSDKTGNPAILDVVANTSEALIKYIDYVVEFSDKPFLVDSTATECRIDAIRHVAEIGLIDKAIYNSLMGTPRRSELDALSELNVKSTIILAFNQVDMSPEGRIQVLKGAGEKRGLIQMAKDAGIEKILVDTAVLDVASIAFASRAIQLVKEEFGLPAGCGPSNAITAWKKVKKGMMGPQAYITCISGATLYTTIMGANFVLYGPIEEAYSVFPAIGMIDAMGAYYARRTFKVKPESETHPMYKVF